MHLFDGVRYFLSPSLPPSRVVELGHVLDNNGATQIDSLNDTTLTHFITNSNRFERWQEVTAREEAGELSVVTDKWVDRSMLLGKLQSPSHYSADPAMIFSGVVACAAELPTSDLEVLSAGISALGGQWRTGLTKDVTHLFVISPSSPKYTTALHFQEHTHVKVLLPHWFDDAVRLGMGTLDTTPYEWPDPPLLKGPGTGEKDEGQEKQREDALKRAAMKKLDAGKKTLYRTATVWSPGAPLPVPNPDSSSSTSPAETPMKNVWQGRRILLSRTLELTGGRREAVEVGITRTGGIIVSGEEGKEVDRIDECDVFVTRYRSGKAYVKAVRNAKTIGTLPWVFHVQSTGILSPPMDQLLWYPIPKKPIEGFSGHEITVTNYTGESREYLKKLIVAMGATFTPSMSGKNTVLIAAYISGTKTTKAASWSIPIVNHIWLEDCFVKWRNLTVALEKYIVFTPGVDFSLMLGERGVGRAVEDIGEEELEMMENDDEEEQMEKGQDEELVNGAEESQKPVPLTTQNSARDAREVEEFVAAGVALDADVDMELGREPDPPEPIRAVQPEELDHQMDVDVEKAPSEMEDEPPTSSRPQGKSLSSRLRGMEKGESAAKTRVKPRKPTASPKKRATSSSSERTPAPELHVSKRKSGKLEMTPLKKHSRSALPDSETSTSDDEVEVVAVVTSPAKEASSGKRKLVKRAGEKQLSWIDDGLAPPEKKKGKAKSFSIDEEEDVEMDAEEVVPAKAKKALPEKKLKKRPYGYEGESEDEMEDEIIVPKKSKNSTRRKLLSESEEEEEPAKVKGRKATAASSSKSRLMAPNPESEEEELVKANDRKASAVTSSQAKLKPAAKKGRIESEEEQEEEAPAKSNGRNATISSSSRSKAKKVTRESDAEEEDERPARTNGRKATAASKTRTKLKAGRKTSHEEGNADDDSEEDVIIISASKSKESKAKGKEVARSAQNIRPKPRPLGKGKKVAERQPETEDEDGEDATPPPLSSRKATSKASKPPAKVIHAVDTDEDEDENEADSSPPPLAKKNSTRAQPKAKRKSTTVESTPSVPSPAKTPARVVSVLMPQLTLTAKKSPLKPRDGDIQSPRLRRTESIRVTAGEHVAGRSSTGRPSTSANPAASGSKAKPNSKPAAAPAPSSSPGTTHEGDMSVTSGRSKRNAAAKASQKLHDEIMPDVMNYQNEMRNEGKGRKSLGSGSVAGGLGKKKRPSDMRADEVDNDDESGKEREAKRRRLSAPETKKKGKTAEEDGSGEEAEESEKPAKTYTKRKKVVEREDDSDASAVPKKFDLKPKKSSRKEDLELSSPSKNSRSVKLMTTQVSLSEDVVKALTKLGVKMTARPAECTHLLAPHLVRTEKFLCALAAAPFILTEKWATDSAAAKRLLNEDGYLLRDKTNEHKYDFVLAGALARAKNLQGGLFSKQVFYITPKVPIDIKLLKNVVVACGGQVNTQVPTLRVLNANPDRHIISCPEDMSIWRPIARNHPIYTHELILTGALKQQVDWDSETFKVPGSQS